MNLSYTQEKERRREELRDAIRACNRYSNQFDISYAHHPNSFQTLDLYMKLREAERRVEKLKNG